MGNLERKWRGEKDGNDSDRQQNHDVQQTQGKRIERTKALGNKWRGS